tara:strand:- start:618 stop:1343 length:726 start_codon:yes stop_codon:yes gene_type:complete
MSNIPKKIMIDPGHGGHDPGAVNEMTGLKEKDVVLAVSLLLKDYLNKYECSPVVTRSSDLFLGLGERSEKANKLKADAFISIHCNSASNHLARGFEVFTTRGETDADRLATISFQEFAEEFPGNTPRPDNSDGDPDKEASFSVLRRTDCPAILFELEFIHNRNGSAFLSSGDNQVRMAMALGKALVKYFSLKPKGDIDEGELPETGLQENYDQSVKDLVSLTAKYNALLRDLGELKDDYTI